MPLTEPAPLMVHPGEWYFGPAPGQIATLLGSCVAMVVWHPVLHCGGLCHYLLPRPPVVAQQDKPDPRYGVHALQFLRHTMEQYAPLSDFHISCFGGSDILTGNARSRIGAQNMEYALQWLHRHHLKPQHQNLGGHYSRNIVLDLGSGQIRLKRHQVDTTVEPVHGHSGSGR